ncbi:MAG: 16S rRNA (guanine(527)-N(7))-methyltransferase RsmG [Chrysiogenales bacterium]|nr:MAG: 16S rRNA (guanine(527)-N(7))-methyltransferase RsmG [Chrysiogenales bacterium]
MEHDDFRSMAEAEGTIIDDDQAKDLLEFTKMIAAASKKFNLTGCATLPELLKNLVLGSLAPFCGADVPRGTVFVDLGTGAGIPGVPLAVLNRYWRGVLIDSSIKKIAFINRVISERRLDNVSTKLGRAEEIAHGDLRECFDLAVSRAMGNIFFVIEAGAPFVKVGGLLYIFSHQGPDEIPEWITEHGKELGLSIVKRNRFGDYGLKERGLLFQKTDATDPSFPRRMAVIKRDIKRLEGRIDRL